MTEARATKAQKELLLPLANGLKLSRSTRGGYKLEGSTKARINAAVVEDMHNAGWIDNKLCITDLGREIATRPTQTYNKVEYDAKLPVLLAASRRVLAAFERPDALERDDALANLRTVVNDI